MRKQIIDENFIRTLRPIRAFSEFNIHSNQIFITNNGEVVKLLSPQHLMFYDSSNIDIEGKILNCNKYDLSREIVTPNTALYTKNGVFCGYIARRAKGLPFSVFDNNFSISDRENLERYNNIQKRLEKIVKKNKNVVFPDLCTCDNIMIDENDKIEIVDYDGLQVGRYGAIEMSTTLDEFTNDYYIPKYYKNDLFTKNLDKKSLILLYFLTAFNIDLSTVGKMNPATNQIVTLEFAFNTLGLSDYEMYEKVSKIFDDSQHNVYLEDTVDKISKDYRMIIKGITPNGIYEKRLIKKQ